MNRKQKKIINLANKLVQLLIDSGYILQTKVSPNYLHIDIDIHKHQHPDEIIIKVSNIVQNWEVRGEYTGTGFQGVEE